MRKQGDRCVVTNALNKSRLVASTECYGWKIECYFGPSPSSDDSLEYSAVAVTYDIENSRKPVEIKDVIQAKTSDGYSVIWWTAGDKSLLTRKVKQSFPGFNW